MFEPRGSRSKSFASSMISGGDPDPQLEASSPDEVALVKFGFAMKMKLVERDRKYCVMQNICGQNEKFDILASFPFTSESKKMGCLLRSQSTGRNIYYLKGAEVVMEQKIKAAARPSLKESCESLAMDGLRTLVFAQKILTDKQVEKFMAALKKAESRLKNRDAHVARVQASLEEEMDYLGVTGVEDKLQNNVEGTIESLKAAGIQVWMLTGDKVETATSIAISSGLKARKNHLFFMRELTHPGDVLEALEDLHKQVKNTCVIIDGKTLDTILHSEEACD